MNEFFTLLFDLVIGSLLGAIFFGGPLVDHTQRDFI